MGKRPFDVDPAEYPFEDHWLEHDGARVHYVDHGSGPAVLLLHGNPTWSFLYRKVIRGLSGFRCIAPDYPGFGFSSAPPGYGYKPQDHARFVRALVDALHLDRFLLVVQDWGGPIGMSLAVERPERVTGLVILNTWCWAPSFGMRLFSLAMGGRPLGRYLQLQKSFFATRIVPGNIVAAENKTPAILKAYSDAFPTPEARLPTWVFPRAIRTEASWLRGTEERLASLSGKPVELVWGMKDPAFGNEGVIARWQRHFPDARVDRLADASHYLQEDRPDRIVAAIERVAASLRSSTSV